MRTVATCPVDIRLTNTLSGEDLGTLHIDVPIGAAITQSDHDSVTLTSRVRTRRLHKLLRQAITEKLVAA